MRINVKIHNLQTFPGILRARLQKLKIIGQQDTKFKNTAIRLVHNFPEQNLFFDFYEYFE